MMVKDDSSNNLLYSNVYASKYIYLNKQLLK